MWVVAIHDGGMVEATTPIFAVSLKDEAAAKQWCDGINQALRSSGFDMWAAMFEVKPFGRYDLPQLSPAEIARLGLPPLKAGEGAYDMNKFVEKFLQTYEDGEEYPLKPESAEPVAPEDVEAALRSLTGK